MNARPATAWVRKLPFVLLLTAACAVGPSYEARPVVPASARMGVPALRDSSRVFFDSLATTLAADTARVQPAPLPLRMNGPDALGEIAWLDLLRDPALDRLIRTAVTQNRDLALARARITEYRALLGVARGPLFPQFGINGAAAKNQVALGSFPASAYTAIRLTGDVAWELDFWGRTRRAVQAAGADADAQAAAEQARVLSLVSDVATGYLQLLELAQEQRIAERTLAARRQTLDLARQRFAQGVISELDVRQFEAQVTVPALRIAQIEQVQAAQSNALSQLIGEMPSRIELGPSLTEATASIVVPDSIPASLLARRPDVRQAELALSAATSRIGVADAARLPAISITGSWGSQASDAGDLFQQDTRIYQAQAGVSVRLFTGGSLQNQSRAARARAEQARAQYEQTALTALREASDAMAAVRATRDQVTALTVQTNALTRAYDLAQIRYSSGVASYLEVLDAQRGVFDSEIALSQAQLRQLTASVQLYKALGGSWLEPDAR